MDVSNIKDYKGGWFIGAFQPSILTTPDFEVAHHVIKAGTPCEPHTHKVAVELTYIVNGKLIASGQHLGTGDMFIYYPEEVADVEFIEDSSLIVVKMPSVLGDKYPAR